MPKSKRNRLVSLTKVQSKGSKLKQKLIEDVRDACDIYPNFFILGIENMRNTSFKEVRNHWRGSRFFLGKNKVMAIALGSTESSAYKENIHLLAQQIQGSRALMCTDSSPETVLRYFQEFKAPHYARSGATATREFRIAAGPIAHLSFAMEPQLRRLGLPTELKTGVIHLRQTVSVCREGDVLTPEQCKILELFEETMAVFRIKVHAQWVNGEFSQLIDDDEDSGEEGDSNMAMADDEDVFA
jgi:mRNA turnover protein 4